MTKQMTSADHWIRDPKAEAVLTSLGISWREEEVQLRDLNWKVTDKNTGRAGFSGKPWSEDNVEDYSTMMLAGDCFPMPVIAEMPNGKIVAAGVHRSKAALLAKQTSMFCYVIRIELEQELRMVSFLTNRKEGVRVDQHEAMEYAISLVVSGGLDPANVAELARVKLGSLNSRLRTVNLRKLLAEGGFRYTIPDRSIEKLNRLKHNIRVMVAAAEMVRDFDFNVDQTTALVGVVCREKTELDQLSRITMEREALNRVQQVVVKTNSEGTPILSRKPLDFPIRKEFLGSMHRLFNLVRDKEVLEDMQIARDSSEASQLASEWKVIRSKLNAMFK